MAFLLNPDGTLRIFPIGTLCISRGNDFFDKDMARKLHCLILNYPSLDQEAQVYEALTIQSGEKRTLWVSENFEQYWEIIYPQ